MMWFNFIRYCSLGLAGILIVVLAPVVLLGRIVPEGDQIAFMYNRHEDVPDWNIYLMDVRTGAVVPFITGEAQDRYPEWSPDGRQLAYHANPRGVGINAPFDVYIADVETRQGTILPISSDFTLANDNQAMVAWSPDGSRIAFHSGIGYYQGRPYRIVISDPSGKHFYAVPNGYTTGEAIYATWSPDGRYLGFSLTDLESGGSTLYVMEVGDSLGAPVGEPTPVFTSLDDILFPAWSPDGKWIAFALSQISLQPTNNGSYVQSTTDELYVVNLDGSDLRQVTHSPADTRNMHPDWVPDGSGILFASDLYDEDFDLYRVNVDGSGLKRILNLPGDEWAPDWGQ